MKRRIEGETPQKSSVILHTAQITCHVPNPRIFQDHEASQ